VPVPNDWPHCIFIKSGIFKKVLNGQNITCHFPDFLDKCRSVSSKITSVRLGGEVSDLEDKANFLAFCVRAIDSSVPASDKNTAQNVIAENNLRNLENRTDDPKLLGKILFGKDVRIGRRAVIIDGYYQ